MALQLPSQDGQLSAMDHVGACDVTAGRIAPDGRRPAADGPVRQERKERKEKNGSGREMRVKGSRVKTRAVADIVHQLLQCQQQQAVQESLSTRSDREATADLASPWSDPRDGSRKLQALNRVKRLPVKQAIAITRELLRRQQHRLASEVGEKP